MNYSTNRSPCIEKRFLTVSFPKKQENYPLKEK